MNNLIYLYVALWPLFNQYVLVDLGEGIPDLTVQVMLVPALFVVTLMSGTPRISGKFMPWLLAYVGYSLVTTVLHKNTSTINVFQLLVQVYVLPYMIFYIILNNRDKFNFKYLAYSMILGGALIAGVGIAEFMAGKNLVGKVDYDEYSKMVLYRTNGPFHDSIGYASLLLIYLSFLYYFYSKNVISKIILLSSSLFIGFGSFVNFSRAAILGLLAVAVFNLSKNIKKIAVFSAFVGILMVPLLLLTTDVIDAFMSSEAVQQRTDTETMEARWRLFNNVIDVITNNPVLGIGYDNYVKMYGGATHNSYLQVLFELGVLGFAMYLMFIWKLVVSDLLKARLSRNMDYYRAMLGIAFVVLFIPNTIVLLHSPHFLTILMISISGIMAYEHSEKNTDDRSVNGVKTTSETDDKKFTSVRLKH